MGKIYVGVNNTARNANKIYVGVNGIARQVKKIYVGDSNGIAREVYSSYSFPAFGPYYSTEGDGYTNMNAISASDCIDAISHGATKIHYKCTLGVSGTANSNVAQLFIHCERPSSNVPSTQYRIASPYVEVGNGSTSNTFEATVDLTANQISWLQSYGLNLRLYVYQTQERNVQGTFNINKIEFVA